MAILHVFLIPIPYWNRGNGSLWYSAAAFSLNLTVKFSMTNDCSTIHWLIVAKTIVPIMIPVLTAGSTFFFFRFLARKHNDRIMEAVEKFSFDPTVKTVEVTLTGIKVERFPTTIATPHDPVIVNAGELAPGGPEGVLLNIHSPLEVSDFIPLILQDLYFSFPSFFMLLTFSLVLFLVHFLTKKGGGSGSWLLR